MSAAINPSGNPKRRPATYGKVSRRFQLDLERHDNELGNKEPDGLHSQATTSTRSQDSQFTDNSLTMTSGTQERNEGTVSTNKDMSRQPKLEVSSEDAAVDMHLFEVPSSDENRPLTRIKPANKRRKVESHYRKGATRDLAVEADIQSKPDTKNFSRKSPTILLSTPLNNGKFVTGGPRPGSVTASQELYNRPRRSIKTSSESTSRKTQSEGRQDTSESGPMRKVAVNPSDATGLLANPGLRLYSSERGHDSGRALAKLPPRTPPRIAQQTSKLKAASVSYLSPSGLDIPGLCISEAMATNVLAQGQNPRNDDKSSSASHTQLKMKDRLAARDGTSRIYESHSESTSDSDGTDSSVHHSSQDNVDSLIDTTTKPLVHTTQLAAYHTRGGLPSTGPKITYIARQRTLRHDDAEDDILTGLEVGGYEFTQKQSRRLDLDVRPPVYQAASNLSNAYEEIPSNASVQTIHELRQSGGNARISGQAETILDDIGSSKLSLRRSGLLDLLAKLYNEDFRVHFHNHGLVVRLVKTTLPSSDILTDTLLCANLLKILVHDGSSQTSLQLCEPMLLNVLSGMLTKEDDIKMTVKLRSLNVSRAVQQDIIRSCQELMLDSIWRYGTPTSVTPQNFSLQTLEYLVRHVRESGYAESILEAPLFRNLLKTLNVAMNVARTALVVDSKVRILLTLSILESSTLVSQTFVTNVEALWDDVAVGTIVSFMIFAYDWSPDITSDIWSLTLRLMLNLASKSEQACRELARSATINAIIGLISSSFIRIGSEQPQEGQSVILDNLLLSLGFLLTIAEKENQNRKLFLLADDSRRTPLDILLELFTSRWQKAFEVVSEDELLRSVPLGFLAALLSYLSVDTSIRGYIASKLEGGNLRHLLIAVSEFLEIYKKTEEIRSIEDDEDLTASFVGKLRNIVELLKQEEIGLNTNSVQM